MVVREWSADWIFSEVFGVKVTVGVVGVLAVASSSDIVWKRG
ncbi:hypothetical protein A2U01_0102236, partial [Trifolium medium]|nr:hypothetical protein [Trifolium medium]